jgi:hypothetical protein
MDTIEAQWHAFDDSNRHIAEDRIIRDPAQLAALAATYSSSPLAIDAYCQEYQRVLALWFDPDPETTIPEPPAPRPATNPFFWEGR